MSVFCCRLRCSLVTSVTKPTQGREIISPTRCLVPATGAPHMHSVPFRGRRTLATWSGWLVSNHRSELNQSQQPLLHSISPAALRANTVIRISQSGSASTDRTLSNPGEFYEFFMTSALVITSLSASNPIQVPPWTLAAAISCFVCM